MQLLRWWLFLLMGFYLTAVLTLLPMPIDYQWYRPHWMLLFVIYCQLQQPSRFNPWVAWVIGLLLDGLLGTHLGEYALVFAVVSYFAALLRPKFLHRALWLQWGKVAVLTLMAQILILWFHAFAGQKPNTLLYWMGTVTSCLCWPLLVLVLQYIGQVFKVATLTSRSI